MPSRCESRAKALARVVEVRLAAAQRLPEWSHAQFLSARASVERLIDEGRRAEAVQAGQSLHLRSEVAGETAYDGAAYDGAMAQITLGRALQMSGEAVAALPHLEMARERFERLHQSRMAAAALTEQADCLTDLGRYDEAAEVYAGVIKRYERLQDSRSAAASKGQLATVRQHQGNYPEALRLYSEDRDVFESLNEPAEVATAWHQTGLVYESAGQLEAAEHAYQKSLTIKVQIGDRSKQAATLGQLGNLYWKMGRSEDAVRLYRQAADIAVQLGDLRREGAQRNNVADELVKLRRYDEARQEIVRAIECGKPFGHVAQSWKTLAILTDIESTVGNQPAALEARKRAIAAYLAYRRDGGAAEIDTTQLVEMVKQDPAAARGAVDAPEISFRRAAEIILVLEGLTPPAGPLASA